MTLSFLREQRHRITDGRFGHGGDSVAAGKSCDAAAERRRQYVAAEAGVAHFYRLFPIANRVNFRDDADDRWSASLAPVLALLPGLPVLRLSFLRRAPRLVI